MSKQIKTIQWFAGLFEGEGTIYRNDKTRCLIMTIKMTDKDVIEEIPRVVGVGRVSARKPFSNPKWKDTFEWILTTRNEIIELANKITPYMGVRRSSKIREVLSGLKKLPPKRELKIVGDCGYVKPTDITNKGQKRHLSRGEKPCLACNLAQRNYMQSWRNKFYKANL